MMRAKIAFLGKELLVQENTELRVLTDVAGVGAMKVYLVILL